MSVEFAILAGLAVTLLLGVVQFGLWMHTRSVATTAARHGVDHVRVVDGSPAAGIAAAGEFLDQAGSALRDRSVDAQRGEEWSTVVVTGSAVRVLPFVSLTVSATVAAPTERVDP